MISATFARSALFLGLISGASAALADQPSLVVRAEFSDLATARRLAAEFGHARLDVGKGVLQVETDAKGMQRLRQAGLKVSVDRGETARLLQGIDLLAKLGDKSISGFSCYRTVEETFDSVATLAAQHPTLLQVSDIGETWRESTSGNGYPIKLIKLSNSAVAGPKPKLMLVTSIHAREYTPAELGTRFIERLLAGYGQDADATWLIDHHEIHAVLQANPDGRKNAELGQMWRKNVNTTQCSGSGAGVDLNRNFPFEWGMHNGSSPSACAETYRGPTPGSEPETQAIVDHVRAEFADQRGDSPTDAAPDDASGLFLDIHSYSELVLWPWGYTDTVAPNGPALATLGRRFAWFNGYTPEQSVGLYPTDGTTDDFAYGELGLASYTFELGTAFFEACGSFEQNTLEPNLAALLYAAKISRAPYQLPAGPDVLNVAAGQDLLLADQAVSVSASIDDSRFNQQLTSHSGPVASVHTITGADLYLGTAPWQDGAVALPMSAGDGSFDSAQEQVQLTLADGLPAGKHIAYVQGRDASGAVGPVSATFIEVIDPSEAVTLQGSVRQIGSGTPLQATIRANQFETSSSTDGSFQRVLPAGEYELQVRATGHEALLLSGQQFNAGSLISRTFELYRLCPLFEDAADSAVATEFSVQAPWTLRTGMGNGGGEAWLPTTGSSYQNSLNVSLTSASIDFSGYESPLLSFDSRCDTEAGYDFGQVEISLSGGAWSEVYRCDGDPQWRRIELPLPQLAGQADARLRFRFSSDTSVTRQGWALDNIRLETAGPACRAQQGTTPPNEVFINGFE
ncbi:M14 family zinc carboxypeptidase [Pseudomarimonas arenosa]|uniref:carboxypeptidase T n=1 Tax=Pseudomarimonas arenosa TaxID=2774145 RepID=A0AAW3ZLX6_9GAMM|nr:M14 family zinc carboxypeptidase [Pseudomarimonas arenosa]MBD8527056.1 hypothetical protein [Pseudomarimonas arenosa]